MATKTGTTTRGRKPSTSKTKAKPVENKEVVEAKAEVVEEVKEVVKEEKSVLKKKKIDLDQLVSCRNVTMGNLIYVSRKTGLQTLWMNYGDEEYLDVGELLTMKASQPKFLSEPWLIIDDEDVVEYLGLKHLYAKLTEVENIDKFFEKSHEEIKSIIGKLPNGTKGSIITRARQLVEEGSLYDNRKIKVLEDSLKIDLSLFEK